MSERSDYFYQSGLHKCAFKRQAFEPLELYMPGVNATMRMSWAMGVRPKLYQAVDAYIMFFRPAELVISSLKQSNHIALAWHYVVSQYVRNPRYIDVNKVTVGGVHLAALAAARFLASLNVEILAAADQNLRGRTSLPEELETQLSSLVAFTAEQLYRYVHEAAALMAEAESAAVTLGEGGRGFDKVGLSMLFLTRPSEARKRVQLLRNTALMLRRFSALLQPGLQEAAPLGEYAGVRPGGLNDRILPTEAALAHVASALFAVKAVSRSLYVYETRASVKHAVFVDKSGSMAEIFDSDIEKISTAAGFALTLYRRFPDTQLYVFDTEVEQLRPQEVVDVLLRVRADGGTNIDPVLEEASRLRGYKVLIISDGITEASRKVLSRFAAEAADRTALILVPPGRTDYNWAQLLERKGRLYYVTSLAQFEKAAVAAL